MTATGRSTQLGVGALVALPLVCCVGLALVVGAGLGFAAVAWIGGLALGMVALAVAVVLVAVRARRRGAASHARHKNDETPSALDFPARWRL
jgi:Flp pilus assembly protein TadB